MLYPTGVQIPFAAQFTASKAGATGLTVYVSVVRVNTDGTRTVVISRASNTAATEVDATNQPGLYSYLLAGASTGTAGVYLATFHTAGTCDLADVPALEIVGAAWVQAASADLDAAISSRAAPADLANLDVAVSTRAPAGAPITLVSPARLGGTEIEIICGDDYGAAPPGLQRLLWTLPAGAYPDLTGGAVALYVSGLVGAQGAGAVVTGSPTGAQQVAVDFTAAASAGLAPEADRSFTLVATTATGEEQSLIPRGALHLRARASE